MISGLFRLVFWGALALLVLPIPVGGDADRQADPMATSAIGVLDTVIVVRDVVDDLKSFCERKPEACAAGGRALETIEVRARTGAAEAARLIAADEASESVKIEAVTQTNPPDNVPLILPDVPVPTPRPQP